MSDENASLIDAKLRAKLQQVRMMRIFQARDAGEIDTTSGAPIGVRAIVGSRPNPDDQLSELRRHFPDAQFAPSLKPSISGVGLSPDLDYENFVFTDPKTKKLTLYNPPGTFFGQKGVRGVAGDFASLPREAAQTVGGGLGAVGGGAAGLIAGGPPGAVAGAIAGAGLGTAAGGGAVDLATRMGGAVDTRTTGQVAQQAGQEALLGAGGQAVGMGIPAAGRALVRGGEAGRQAVGERVSQFAVAGTTPTAAQATNRAWMDTLESLVSKIPGGSGPIRRRAVEVQAKIGQFVESRAANTARVAEPTVAGRVIEEGSAGFLERNRARWLAMDDRIKAAAPADLKTDMSATRALLQERASQMPDLPATSSALTPSGIRSLTGSLEADLLGPGAQGVSFATLQAIRSRVGQRLGDPVGLTDDLPRAELKRVYAAMTADMRGALAKADAANGTNLVRQFDQANKFYAATLDRTDKVLNKLVGKRLPEQIYLALESSGNQGGTAIRALMRSLTDDEKQIVAATVMRRLGRARAGQQGAEGETFSLESFLTRWNTITPEAKSALFEGPAFGMLRSDLDKIAQMAGAARESSRAFANASGSAGAAIGQTMAMAGGGSLMTGLLTGSPNAWGMLGVVAMAGAQANAAAHLMTNPRFVHWLARTTVESPNSITPQLTRLGAIAANSDPETRAAIQSYLATFANLGSKPAPATATGRGRRQ